MRIIIVMESLSSNRLQSARLIEKSPPVRVMDSTALFASDRYQEVQIIHAGKVYRLRKTRQGKLILTT